MRYSLLFILSLFLSQTLQAQSNESETSQNRCKSLQQSSTQTCSLKTSANATESFTLLTLKNGKTFKIYESDNKYRLNAKAANKTEKNGFTCFTQTENSSTNICYQSKK